MPSTIVVNTLLLGRKNILKVLTVRSINREKTYPLLFTGLKTTQAFEQFMTLTGFGYANDNLQGEPAEYDTRRVLYVKNFNPLKRTIGFEYTEESEFTDQYGELMKSVGYVADAFVNTRERVAANIFNNGFSNLFPGPDTVSLFNTAHPTNGGPTWANRPAVDIVLSQNGVQQALNEIRAVKDPRGVPMRAAGNFQLVVPVNLQSVADVIALTEKKPGTMDNDINTVRMRIQPIVMDELSSQTAWFLTSVDKAQTGLFCLDQMPYKLRSEEDTTTGNRTYVARESYVMGWQHPYMTWGTVGG